MISRVLLFIAILVTGDAAYAGRSEFDFTTARPALKAPIPIALKRNPLLAVGEPERPLPVLKDKEDPVFKLQEVLTGKVRSVIRDPSPLILVEARVFREGDEILIGAQTVLPKFRVVLKRVGDDRLVFDLLSLDQQRPGQVEATVFLPQNLRRN